LRHDRKAIENQSSRGGEGDGGGKGNECEKIEGQTKAANRAFKPGTKFARALTLLSRVSSGKNPQTPQGHRNCLARPVACFCSRRKAEPRRLSQNKGEAMMCCSAAAALVAAAAAADDDDDGDDEVFRTQLRG
jgi:hypothetical protein